MEINVYHVIGGNLVSAIIRLLEKVYLSEKRCIFFSPIEERVNVVDRALWTFSTNAFIPHGDSKLGYKDQQPIYFTNICENPNNAEVLVMVDTIDYASYCSGFEKIIMIFEDISLLNQVNEIYSDLKKNGEKINYWKQSSKGWEKVD